MSFVLLGILNSQAAGGGALSSYDLLETQVLSSSASSVNFTGLDSYSDYKHLQIRAVARTDRNDFQDKFALRLNGVTSNGYITHSQATNFGQFTTGYQDNFSRIFTNLAFDLFSTNETSAAFGCGVFDFLDFASPNKNTTVRYLSGMAGGTQAESINFVGGMRPDDSSSLTSITLLSSLGANFTAPSRFSLYGVK